MRQEPPRSAWQQPGRRHGLPGRAGILSASASVALRSLAAAVLGVTFVMASAGPAAAQSATPASQPSPAASPTPAAWVANDPVSRLLAERGLMPGIPATPAGPSAAADATGSPDTAAPGLMRTVRDKTSDMVLAAMNFLGVPYRHGGNSASDGFDCSGFTRYIFEMSLGLVLPRRADDQASASGLFEIQRTELKPGDLVFFNTLRRTFSHVGIYIGDGKFIHSPRAGSAVRIEDMRMSYWQQRFTGARRVDAEIVRAATREAQGSR